MYNTGLYYSTQQRLKIYSILHPMRIWKSNTKISFSPNHIEPIWTSLTPRQVANNEEQTILS